MGRDCDEVAEDERVDFLKWAYASSLPSNGAATSTPRQKSVTIDGTGCTKSIEQLCSDRAPGRGAAQAEAAIAAELDQHKKTRVYTENPVPGGMLEAEFRESIRRWRAYSAAACASVATLGPRAPSQTACTT